MSYVLQDLVDKIMKKLPYLLDKIFVNGIVM